MEAFLEKSERPAPTNRINAGAYVIEREVIEEHVLPGAAVSFEREVFPALVGAGLFGHPVAGYWVDIGTPERYLEATYDLLAGTVASTLPARDETGSLICEGCLTAGAHVGPQTVLGRHCSVGSDSTVERSVLHDGCRRRGLHHPRGSVLAEGVRVGDGARIEPGAVIGAGAARGRRRGHSGRRPGRSRSRGRGRGHRRGRGRTCSPSPRSSGTRCGGWSPRACPGRAPRGPGGLRHGRLGGGRRHGAAAMGRRARRASHGARIRAGARLGAQTLVLCVSYSGSPRRRSPASRRRGGRAQPGGADHRRGPGRARAGGGVPVIGVPAGMQPRAAVVYMAVAVLECAAACGARRRCRSEIEAAGRRCRAGADGARRPRTRALAGALGGHDAGGARAG